MTDAEEPRLTSLAHGGGCGCKIAPAVLRDMLAWTPQGRPFADLLVGNETSDDAAVWRLNDEQALIATTDFFMPVVDDPFHFGQIAATNALSDIYAMGGKPIFALAIVGLPVNVLSPRTMGRILQGGAAACTAAGIPVAGGHSIDSAEPIYGLAVMGLVHPDQVLTNRGARPGDVLVLTKPLGIGVLSAAFKQERLGKDGYRTLKAWTTRLNSFGAKLAGRPEVHAVTDVTGFGLLGHALEMARGAGATVEIDAEPPTLPGVYELLQAGVRTGASARNWASYGHDVELPDDLEPWRRDLLTDPQTSGGLLIALPESELKAFAGFARLSGEGVQPVGRVVEGPPRVRVVG